MGISKKMRKAPLPKPPLSFIDKLIYGLILNELFETEI
jgi:hypothetical protein